MLGNYSKQFLFKHGKHFYRSTNFFCSTVKVTEEISSNSPNSITVSQNIDDDLVQTRRLKSIGRALNTYITRAKENARLMAKEKDEFELGRRHLANMMGLDPDTMTQTDIDRSIEYLFPSSLHDKKARPVMKSPELLLPKFHKLDFDDEGRPADSHFFTLKPKFYRLLSDIGERTKKLVKYLGKEEKNEEVSSVLLSGSLWLSQKKLSTQLGEKLSDELYANWIMAFDYLASLPNSSLEKEFIMSYRESITSVDKPNAIFGGHIPRVSIDPVTKTRYATAKTTCKATKAMAVVRDAGTGKYYINGHHFSCFRSLLARECLISPLIVADVMGKVDIEATTTGDGGLSALPRSVRHAVSLGIAALYPEKVEKMKISGLLTKELRKKERSKVNQPGARAKWIWKRR
ncbi:28S ribosomal protein S9, mitochondrial [Strongyloides ratti]|uniref:28S ribosomal protein S9, mitochondrial n=1 Tax=Strongyloides ratti TaxID=34506 RepID=A0A090L909_STRRB|nr:28S ribosomal protein S9, mitochondrial [Strongyloides ratti]CEF66197.1 28S ribosomal protein S9, mitochondrial [Strongyloides ratti]